MSFRSGLVSAAVVGVVSGVALLSLAILTYFLFGVADGIAELEIADSAEDQLLEGVNPRDLELPTAGSIDLGTEGGSSTDTDFWVVMEGAEILLSSGSVDREVIESDSGGSSFGFAFEGASDDTQVGGKRVRGRDWLYVERQVTVADGTAYDVIVAGESSWSLESFLLTALVVVVPIALIISTVAGLITSFLSRRALRRVEHIRAEVELITQQSLDRRVPTVDAADNIDKLAHTMNDMLGRLEVSSAQQNQFLADASHELRSPVAGMVAQLDVASAYPDRVDQETLLPKLRDEANRLQVLVDDLLFLSRSDTETGADGSRSARASQMIDLAGLITSEVEHQALVQPHGNLRIGRTCEGSVVGAPRDLQRALRNLLHNALRHCDHAVTVDCDNIGTHVVISVTDDGPGVAAEHAERIFDRFVRSDDARSRDVGGAGLGLAIAQEIARRHGGFVTLAESPNRGATFHLYLPIVAGAPAQRVGPVA